MTSPPPVGGALARGAAGRQRETYYESNTEQRPAPRTGHGLRDDHPHGASVSPPRPSLRTGTRTGLTRPTYLDAPGTIPARPLRRTEKTSAAAHAYGPDRSAPPWTPPPWTADRLRRRHPPPCGHTPRRGAGAAGSSLLRRCPDACLSPARCAPGLTCPREALSPASQRRRSPGRCDETLPDSGTSSECRRRPRAPRSGEGVDARGPRAASPWSEAEAAAAACDHAGPQGETPRGEEETRGAAE
jgi:hypothetical protein